MFNRRIIAYLAVLICLLIALWWTWRTPPGVSLNSAQSEFTYRYTQSLDGNWDSFSSLHQAWTTETERVQGKTNQSFLTAGRVLTLPSSERFSIVAKRFRLPAEWSSRTMLLTLHGVSGHASIYLNGSASPEKLAEFEGSGGNDVVEIPPKAFRYGEDNILIIALDSGLGQRAVLMGSHWPNSGQISGDLSLQAVAETSLTSPQANVAWNGANAVLTLKVQLWHHGFVQAGPWTVDGVLSDGSAGVAEQITTVQPQANADHQAVTLTFTIPGAKRWTTQDPFLYQLHLTVTNSQGDRDDLAFPIGLRTLTFSNGKWLLNDQALLIKGVALAPDQEYAIRNSGKVDSWLESEQRRGINLIYFIGGVPDDLWLQAADRAGMGVWAELPAAGIPSNRLPKAAELQGLSAEKMLHPSLWAWTVGKGLDSDPAAQNYMREAVNVVQPDLAFALKAKPSSETGLPVQQALTVQGNKISGIWGSVQASGSAGKSDWANEKVAAACWALLMLFLAGMNIRAVVWRYKEIGLSKPKRSLRNAWLWNSWFNLAREWLIGGLLTSVLYSLPTSFSVWFPHIWPGLELLQAQSPWLIWSIAGMIGVLLRLLQVGVAAPHFPDSPHTMGLTFWFERRYYFTVFVALCWAAVPWGVPAYYPLLGYVLLNCLFFPIRFRDVRRMGGHYAPLLWVPGILLGVAVIWGALHYADWIFLWHMLYS